MIMDAGSPRLLRLTLVQALWHLNFLLAQRALSSVLVAIVLIQN